MEKDLSESYYDYYKQVEKLFNELDKERLTDLFFRFKNFAKDNNYEENFEEAFEDFIEKNLEALGY